MSTWKSYGLVPKPGKRRRDLETVERALEGDHPYALNRRDRRAIEAHQKKPKGDKK